MTGPYYSDDQVTLWHGDALNVLRTLPDESVGCCVTSPPYLGLRDYGEPGQYGMEATPAEYVETMRAVFAEVRRVLAKDGTLWLNLGDSYSFGSTPLHNTNRPNLNRDGTSDRRTRDIGEALGSGRAQNSGLPAKNLLGIPWRVAFALQDDGWILRNAVVWHKPNAMPESVTDRLSSNYEHLFLLTRSPRYWFDLDAIREPQSQATIKRLAAGPVGVRRITPDERRAPNGVATLEKGRNPGSVWTIPTQPFTAAHFAVMPPELARRCILAGCRPGGSVLDPFAGSCTTGMVALRHGRRFVGVDLSATYLDLALRTRLAQGALIEPGDGAA